MTRIKSTLFLSFTTLIATMAAADARAPSAPGGVKFQRVADESSEEHGLRTCWYDEKGTFTGSEPAAPGAKAGSKNQVATSGEHSWSYTVAGTDAAACPEKLPVSTISRQI